MTTAPTWELRPDAADRPLAGVKVLDLTNVLAGPFCSYQLALLGADVIKVEVPGRGDLARQLGPDAELNQRGVGASFIAQNSGKRSVALDLKIDSDRQIFEAMLADADVLLENFRPGVMARLGYSWDTVRKTRPDLVYCAISGFGQHGPMSQRPAYDQIVQGLSGMMSTTGTDQTAMLRVGFPICDTFGGMLAASAINAALVKKSTTGKGAMLDVSMLEASLSAMGWAVNNYLVVGSEPKPMGNENPTAAPSGTFTAADGLLNIAANRQSQFEMLCRLIGRPELVLDPRFVRPEDRKAHRSELNAEIDRGLSSAPVAWWEETLPAHGVPAARVLTVAEAVELPQLSERGFFASVPVPGDEGRHVRVMTSGVQVDGRTLTPLTRPPLLDEHDPPSRLGPAGAVDGIEAS